VSFVLLLFLNKVTSLRGMHEGSISQMTIHYVAYILL